MEDNRERHPALVSASLQRAVCTQPSQHVYIQDYICMSTIQSSSPGVIAVTLETIKALVV